MQIVDLLRPDVEILIRVAIAMALGAVVGLERELADKPAGLRTHMLVAGAAALFVPLGVTVLDYFTERFSGPLVSADPIRIIESVITGISFLGAGTIIHYGPERGVEGLTTAASILFTAGLGTAVTLGRTVLAIGATALAFVTLSVLGLIERHVASRKMD
ncbi:MAG: MgtC/SapB family protein [Anaerolineae bacterium]